MLIQRDQKIVGRPAAEVRDFLRELRDRLHSTAAFAEQFDLTPAEAVELIKALDDAGFVEASEPARTYRIGRHEPDNLDGVVLWTTTISGSALAKARIGNPMRRAKAEALLESVIARAREMNASDDYLHWIEELVLYGSLARPGDAPMGDIDLGVRLEPRFEFDDLIERQKLMIVADGARPTSFPAALGYAETKVMRVLKSRSSRVDLVLYDDWHPLPPGATHRTVYERRS